MFSVPIHGTPAVVAVILGLGGVFVVLSGASRRAALRTALLCVALGAVAAGGALALYSEPNAGDVEAAGAALTWSSRLFPAGVAAVCLAAAVLARQLGVSEQTLMRALADGARDERELEHLKNRNAALQSQVEQFQAQLARSAVMAADLSASPVFDEIEVTDPEERERELAEVARLEQRAVRAEQSSELAREQARSQILQLEDRIAFLESEAAAHECPVIEVAVPVPAGPTSAEAARVESRESLDDLIDRETAWVSETLPSEEGVSAERSVEAVAHDLRVPLTSIRSFSEILLEHEDVVGDERAEFLQIIRTESERLTRMVNDLLHVRRVKSGAGELEVSAVDMRDLVRGAINSLNGLAMSRGVSFEGAWDHTERTIFGDRDRLHRMVANLLSNAVKFSPENGAVEVILREGSTPGSVLLGVRDHGPGIAEEDQEIVFERFSRGATGPENVSGTGLGLAICREIVDVHGARIWPESRPQSGATLWVEFPAPGDNEPAPATEDLPAAATA